MASRRLAFRVEYDGTHFHGWARQPGTCTVQGELEGAFERLVGHFVQVDGASRTDAGVHARDQLAAVTLDHPIRPPGLVKAINRRLADRGHLAAIDAVEVVADDFYPRFANAGKTYCYRVRQGRATRPLSDRFAWRVPWAFDPERICAAADALLGTRDFASFAARDGAHSTSVRTLTAFSMTQEPYGVWAFRITGTAFMKHMVRNIMGTLVDIGRGRWPVEEMARILAARDRSAAGPTAPPQGLELERIWRGTKPHQDTLPRDDWWLLEAPEAGPPRSPG